MKKAFRFSGRHKFGTGLLLGIVVVTAMGASEFFESLTAPDGSAAAPTYSFNDDTDSGLYRGGANQLNLSAGGVNRLQIDDTGQVVEINGDAGVSGRLEADMLAFADASELTISAGAITISQTYHRVDTSGDDPSDDLDTISGGAAGDFVVLRAEHDDRDIVVKNGTGNIAIDADVTLDDDTDVIVLLFNGTNWTQTGGSAQGGGGGSGDVAGPGSSTDNAVARFDSTTGKLIQNSAVTIADTSGNMAGVGTINTHTLPGGTDTFAMLAATQTLSAKTLATPTVTGSVSFPDDTRQTHNPGSTVAGLNVGAQAGDPSTPVDGDLWYDSTANTLDARINGATVNLGAGGGGTSGSNNEILTDNGSGGIVSESNFTFDGSQLSVSNLTDAASNRVASIVGNNRAVAANSDEAYLSLFLDNDAGTSKEFGRLIWRVEDKTDTSENGRFAFAINKDGTIADRVTIDSSGVVSAGGLVATSGSVIAFSGTFTDKLTASSTLELGHASDTTLARASAGNITVEGNAIYRAGGTDVPVADGGTGRSTATAYAVLTGGTTATGAHQSIASVGTSGQVLTSNGAGALPTFQAAGGSTKFRHQLRVYQAKFPSSNAAAIDTGLTQDALLFDAGTDESVFWAGIHVVNYAGGNLEIDVTYSMASVSGAGDVIITGELWAISPGDAADIDTASYGTLVSTTEATPTTSGHPGTLTLTFDSAGELDSLANGDTLVVRIARDADNGSDTQTNDFEFRSAVIEEQ